MAVVVMTEGVSGESFQEIRFRKNRFNRIVNYSNDDFENAFLWNSFIETLLSKRRTLCYHFYAHGAGSALYTPDGRVKTGGIQIGHLLLGYIRHLLFGDLADLVFVWCARTLRYSRGSL